MLYLSSSGKMSIFFFILLNFNNNMIKINKSENIASNITVEKDQEKIIGKLKKYTEEV